MSQGHGAAFTPQASCEVQMWSVWGGGDQGMSRAMNKVILPTGLGKVRVRNKSSAYLDSA